jgi:tellurite resistance protein TehA-like permease
MPVVPPMVSAATGALLVPHLPPGQPQQTLLLACYALAGATLLAGLLVLGQLWQRLVRHGPGATAVAPTVWIPLGFLGQSVTAVHHLGALAPAVLPAYGRPLQALTVVYGVPVWGFALLWVGFAVGGTRRAMAAGLPFGLGWWAFVFPLATVVTGTDGLADATGLVAFETLAGALLVALVAVWAVVAARTLTAVVNASRATLAPAG